MARLTIEITENEYALYDYTLWVNGVVFEQGENFTREEYALQAARGRWKDGR